MKDASARTTYLHDYQPPAFLIETTELDFDLYEDHALVESRLRLRPNPDFPGAGGDELVLHGRELALEGLWLDDRELTADDYRIEAESLRIPGLALLCGGDAAGFMLRCRTRIEPQNNSALEGLYQSGKMFCTQCEAEGFRRITYFLDRPDVMSKFTTTIRAERDRYPVLLS
ncbi:MAG: aminopeptidase N, partial [Gammaproteobacteria bacterium]|nr:aminopeptidase N [Gammaproteobacteria bacterium]